MRYVIVTIEWCLTHGIIAPEGARRSLDGSKVLLHHEFIAPVLGGEESIYVYDSTELRAILSGVEWTETINQEEAK